MAHLRRPARMTGITVFRSSGRSVTHENFFVFPFLSVFSYFSMLTFRSEFALLSGSPMSHSKCCTVPISLSRAFHDFLDSLASNLHRGREQTCACPPAQIPACALTHGAPNSDDDERPLVRPRVLKPVAEARETPTQDRHRECVLHCIIGSAEWSIPPTGWVLICRSAFKGVPFSALNSDPQRDERTVGGSRRRTSPIFSTQINPADCSVVA